MYYSVCASAVFSGVSLHESLPLIRAAGADTYEFWSWTGKNLDALERAQRETGLTLTAMCTSEFVLTDPARRDTYLDGLRRSIPVANRLGCRTLITQVGPELPNIPRAVQHASIVDGLKACVPLLESAGITLVFEPLNLLVNHPGYYLSRSDEAFEIAREVSSPFVKVLYDIYHQQITEGNLIATITANAPLIGHIHAASVPGRHELTHPSEINYPAVFAALKNAGYTGAVGLEYVPVGDPSESLRAVLSSMPL